MTTATPSTDKCNIFRCLKTVVGLSAVEKLQFRVRKIKITTRVIKHTTTPQQMRSNKTGQTTSKV